MRRPVSARAILLAVGLALPIPCFASLTPAPGWPIESNQANQRLGFFMAPATMLALSIG